MRVRVHFNLHRKDYSVVDPGTRRVIANVSDITLLGVTFHVSEPGRQRVIRTKRRAVHAYAVGTIGSGETRGTIAVTYNPYRAGHFHIKGRPDKPIRQAAVVTFQGGYCWIDCETQ